MVDAAGAEWLQVVELERLAGRRLEVALVRVKRLTRRRVQQNRVFPAPLLAPLLMLRIRLVLATRLPQLMTCIGFNACFRIMRWVLAVAMALTLIKLTMTMPPWILS